MLIQSRIFHSVPVLAFLLTGLVGCDPNAKCKEDPACAKEGICSLSPEGQCWAGFVEDCKASEACKKSGRSSVRQGACIAKNKKARFNFHIEETLEAGVSLLGSEVKSALYGQDKQPKVVSIIGGLGGRDITIEGFEKIVARGMEIAEKGSDEEFEMFGVRG